jgi:hypothetical protein
MIHDLGRGGINMERCRSAEASVCYTPAHPSAGSPIRQSRARDQTPSPLLFTSPPIASDHFKEATSRRGSLTPAEPAVTPEVAQAIQEENEKVEEQRVWGMERWGWEPDRHEVRRGVRLVAAEEVGAGLGAGLDMH